LEVFPLTSDFTPTVFPIAPESFEGALGGLV
jgi:hypothetical protein